MTVLYTTRPVRLSYPHLDKPRAVKGSTDLKYGAMGILRPEDVEEFKAKIMEEAQMFWADKLQMMLANPNVRKGLRSGAERPQDPNVQGTWFFNATSKERPEMFDENKNELMSSSRFYPGCWVRMALGIKGYTGQGEGIGIYLNAIQFWRDDARIDNRKDAKDAFDDERPPVPSGAVGGENRAVAW